MTILLVLAKAPVPGQVKTRLCPPATAVGAARIAAAVLLDTLDTVRETVREALGVRPVVAWTGDRAAAERSVELRDALRGLTVLPQRGADLGHRIAAAHADVAALAPGVPVLQISTDTPQLSVADLCASFDRLAAPHVDGVLGPASDGGWWALGLREPRHAAELVNVPTSRPDTGARTLAALRRAALRIVPLRELADVDTVTDARAVAALVPDGRFAAQVAAELPVPSRQVRPQLDDLSEVP